jgi:glycosyltransferase involved in cell wall biosynthesis
MKTLSILIPTYNRSKLLQIAVESISHQIENLCLQEYIDIIVCNDRSPDDTESYLETLKESYIIAINRPQNLGMSANILSALTEACKSEWVLILTDDDTLASDTLPIILEKCNQLSASDVSICLTPRYSYLENGELHCIACESFDQDTLVEPSPLVAGQLMADGFILSGILLRPDKVDYSLWIENIENSMFPAILTGATLRSQRGYYWSSKIVNHTVLNECFWDRWGKTEVDREYRLFCDWTEAFSILGNSYQTNSSDYNKFWRGVNQRPQELYNQYLFSMPAGMAGLVELYGAREAAHMVAKTIGFTRHCFWIVLSSYTSYMIKALLKSVFLFRKLSLVSWKTFSANFLVLLMTLGYLSLTGSAAADVTEKASRVL